MPLGVLRPSKSIHDTLLTSVSVLDNIFIVLNPFGNIAAIPYCKLRNCEEVN